MLTLLPSFLNGTTTLTSSLVDHPRLPSISILATPAVALATPACTPFTLPSLYVNISLSPVRYVIPAVVGYMILEGSSSSVNSVKSSSDNTIYLVPSASCCIECPAELAFPSTYFTSAVI